METYAKQSKSSARTLSARAGHGQPDMATILQAYRNRTAQLAALTDDDEQALQGKFTTQLQEDDDEALQGKFVAQLQSDDEEKPLQGKFLTQLQSAEEEEPLQQKAENRTGLPDRLKNGVENLSGYSLDAVKVHYNSPKPAQLQALAYTQGTDIHVGPGQERYLGHEAWHVVQQMQGRVQPTTQLQGVAVNDNEGLEREADVMGEKAVTKGSMTSGNYYPGNCIGNLIQRVSEVKSKTQNLPYKTSPTGSTENQLAGAEMEAWLDPRDPLRGSAPGSGDAYALYSHLNTKHNVSFIKGHLLNDNLGGPGLPHNLFPITAEANKAHSHLVEEPLKANFLALSRHLGAWGGGASGVPTTAQRLYYKVKAIWKGSGDFLSNPVSQFDCVANYVAAGNTLMAPLIAGSIISDPATAPPNSQNKMLSSIGWGSSGSGARTGTTAFGIVKASSGKEIEITGPRLDNANNCIGRRVYITLV